MKATPPPNAQVAAMDETMAAFEEAISPCVVPVYALNERKIVTAAGSAVLVQPKENRFVLVTAAHVLNNSRFSPLFTWGGSPIGLIRLHGRSLTTDPGGARRVHDRIDLAVLELEADTVANLRQTDARFAPGSVLRFEGSPEGFYSFMGYPETLNEPVPTNEDGRLIYVRQRHFVAFRVQVATKTAYRRVRCTPEYNFVGMLDHRELVESGDVKVGPHPLGISGGAVFYLGSADDIYNMRRNVWLAGIGTEYHERKKLIVAASARSVREIVATLLTPT